MVKGERPEFTAPPDIFYNDTEARKYTTSSRMENIQVKFLQGCYRSEQYPTQISMPSLQHALLEQEALTQRALELLALPDDDQVKLLLDVGCGSGLSGQALTEKGHVWMVSMLTVSPAQVS